MLQLIGIDIASKSFLLVEYFFLLNWRQSTRKSNHKGNLLKWSPKEKHIPEIRNQDGELNKVIKL